MSNQAKRTEIFLESVRQYWPVLICCVVYLGAIAGFRALRIALTFPGRNVVVVWPYGWVTPMAAMALLLAFLTAGYHMLRRRQGEQGHWPASAWSLMLLPPSLTPLFFPSLFPLSLASPIAVYIPCLVLSLVLWQWLRQFSSRSRIPSTSQGLTRPVVLITVIFSVFFWLTGWYFSVNAGPTLGDEGYYIIQAMSLRQDHDLDLRNNFSPLDNKRLHSPGGRHKVHISQYARGGHLYSWHPFGISVLMAPFEGFGLPGRHLVLGMIAGLGSGAVLLASLLLGAEIRVAVVFTTLFSLSALWGVYACRALPETAGGTLTAWLLASLLLYRRAPWRALLIGVLTCGLLPWFQTRFAPISACGGVFFFYLIWTGSNAPASRLKQSLVFCVLAGMAGAVFWAVQWSMFEGGCPYPVKVLLFSYPQGMWNIVFGWRSITYMLPLFGFLSACVLWVIFFDRERRAYALMAMLIFIVILATSCSCRWWHGGSSPFGRYLLVVSPLFVPFGAFLFSRLTRPVQWFALFLAVVSCVFFILLLVNLPELHRFFTDPRGHLALVIPVFSGLANPFYAPWFGPLFFLLCLLMVWLPDAPRTQMGLLLVLLILSVAAHKPENLDHGRKLGFVVKRQNTLLLEQVDLRRAVIRVKFSDDRQYSVDEVLLNRLAPFNQENIAQVTTERLPDLKNGHLVSQPLIPKNDWQGRELSWVTLIPPFRFGGPGERLFCVQAQGEGNIAPMLAVAELSPSRGRTAMEVALPLTEGKSCQCHVFSFEGIGQTHILAHIGSGQGILHITALRWYPVDRAFLEKTHLTAPCALAGPR